MWLLGCEIFSYETTRSQSKPFAYRWPDITNTPTFIDIICMQCRLQYTALFFVDFFFGTRKRVSHLYHTALTTNDLNLLISHFFSLYRFFFFCEYNNLFKLWCLWNMALGKRSFKLIMCLNDFQFYYGLWHSVVPNQRKQMGNDINTWKC